MAIVEIDNPDDLDPKAVPEAIYGAVIEDVDLRVIDEGAKFNAGDREVVWRFRIDDADAPQDVQGIPIWQNTNVEKGKGALYKRFMATLGYEGDALKRIDLDELKEMNIKISVKEYMGQKDQVTGEKKIRNKVVELLMP